MSFIDEAAIHLIAGSGGNGCLSFRREKFIPKGGPDGGDGGKGGSIFLKADSSLTTLQDFRLQKKYQAKNGSTGEGKNKHGKDASDIILKVPVGTVVFEESTEEEIADLKKDGDLFEVVSGGKGGLGNARFKSSTNRAPRKTTEGEKGEELSLQLELRLIADVGLLGFPNAGKSTLISSISEAKPKIANYPFTTLTPNLGVVEAKSLNPYVIADIPGLIPGAAKGAGLGIRFLKHLSRVKLLLHLIDVSEIKPEDVEEKKNSLDKELKEFDESLSKLEQWIVLTKADTKTELKNDYLSETKKTYSNEVFLISSITGEGLSELVKKVSTKIIEINSNE
ncbi:MAG: Obg family GTPase CgtA [Gammaproteobacteria bacterium]|tara:strand:+ start:1061 stop:2071 length:1011 start_codon:yes stop_codon:yes gene_type:complete